MRKALILVVVLLSSFLSVYATNVSGLITTNTIWTKANSPYIITGDVLVDSAITLTIEPGAIVKFDGKYYLYIDGQIIAAGTVTDPILFTSNMAFPKLGDWRGISLRIKSAPNPCLFRNCKIEYGGGIAVLGPQTTVDSCYFANSERAVSVSIDPIQAQCTITHNIITKNTTGISGTSRKGDIVMWNEISYCSNNAISTAAIGSNGTKICYNTIHHCKDALNIFINGPNCCVVQENLVYMNSGYGILARGDVAATDSFRVLNNQFIYNDCGIQVSTGNVLFEHNEISNNTIGIMYMHYGTPARIQYNCITNNSTKNFYNYIKSNVEFPYNYWGTTDSATIDSMIYDYWDDFVSGKFKFWPFLTAKDTGCHAIVTPPTKIPTVLHVNSIKIYPNPSTNLLTIEASALGTTVMIMDMTGKLIYSSEIKNEKHKVDISQWQPGVYIVKCLTETDMTSVKFVKE